MSDSSIALLRLARCPREVAMSRDMHDGRELAAVVLSNTVATDLYFSGTSLGAGMLLREAGFSMYFFGSPSKNSLHRLLQNP